MKLGRFATLRDHFRARGQRGIAGISGGSTSGTMGALLDPIVLLSFQNTGREHPRTYEFVGELEDGIGRPIVRLEYRPPPTKGGRPCEARFDVVRHDCLDTTGAPFEMLMEAINAFRAKEGKGKIAPWWKSRLCTTYMKTRTARAYVESLGWESGHDEYVGLRADEPDRIARIRVGHPKRIGRFAPLSDAGITAADVAEFWDMQPFKLGLDPILGNCTGCFLKDQADLSRAMRRPESDIIWWHRMQAKYPGWGGKNFVGYRQLASEYRTRIRIESELRDGVVPENTYRDIDDERFRLVVIQERRRLANGATPFSCGCEGATTLANMEPEEEDAFILSLPSEEAA